MMLGARTAAWAKSGEWVNPYVTDGLVSMWDGEWNAGGGVHDQNTRCVDISGNGHDLTMSNMVIGDNFFACDSHDNYTTIENVGLLHPEYVEICVEAFGEEHSNKSILSDKNLNGIIYSAGNSGNRYVAIDLNRKFGVLLKSGYTRGSVYFSNNSIYANGNQVVVSGSWAASFENGFRVASNDLQFGGASKTKILSIRLYDHKIDNIAANYAIDKARFNLPDAA